MSGLSILQQIIVIVILAVIYLEVVYRIDIACERRKACKSLRTKQTNEKRDNTNC